MPTGIPNVKKVKVQAMDQDELKAMEERTKDKRSPIHEDDFQMPQPSKVFHTPEGRAIQQFGGNTPKVGHQGTIKAFARIEHDYEGWIPMTMEESLKYQGICDTKQEAESYRLKGSLVGYDADKQLGLIRKPKRGQNEKATVSSSADLS